MRFLYARIYAGIIIFKLGADPYSKPGNMRGELHAQEARLLKSNVRANGLGTGLMKEAAD